MLAYIIFLLGLASILCFYRITKKKSIFYLAFLWLGLFSGFRFDVGVDFQSYWRIVSDIALHGTTDHFEYGNILLVNLIAFFNGGPQVYFLIMAIATNLMVGSFIHDQVKYRTLIVLMYVLISLFYFASFNTVRQSFAVACFLFSIRFLLSKEFFKYTLMILVASLFHKSALIFWPLYFVLTLKFSFKLLFSFGVLYCITLVLLFELIAKTFFSEVYLQLENSSSTPISMLLFVGLGLFFLAVVKGETVRHVVFRNLLVVAICNVVISVFLPMFSTSLLRVNMYFVFSLLPITSLYLESSFVRGLRFPQVLLIFLCCLVYFFIVFNLKFEDYQMLPFSLNFELLYEN